MTLCPVCGRSLLQTRGGVELSPLKARIYDAIKHAGPDGISGRDIMEMLNLNMAYITLRVHISQINDKLVEGNERIVGRGGYRITETRQTFKSLWKKPYYNDDGSINDR